MFDNKLEEKRCISVAMMKKEIKRIWCLDITKDFCKPIDQSMLRRFQATFEVNGGHTYQVLRGPGRRYGKQEGPPHSRRILKLVF